MIQTGAPFQTGKNAKYMQLADWISERIRSGEFAPGKRLPSNRKLAGQWNLSAITITAAMDELVREGKPLGQRSLEARDYLLK